MLKIFYQKMEKKIWLYFNFFLNVMTKKYFSSVLHSRMSRQGEVLFSMNGTPVTITNELSPVNFTNAKDQAKIVQDVNFLSLL